MSTAGTRPSPAKRDRAVRLTTVSQSGSVAEARRVAGDTRDGCSFGAPAVGAESGFGFRSGL